MRFISTLKIDCGVEALSSSAAERGSAIAIVAVATSATIIDSNQEKTYIANLVKEISLNRRAWTSARDVKSRAVRRFAQPY